MKNQQKALNLREYALMYLGRYNNTEIGLKRVLVAKIRRWSIGMIQQGIDEVEVSYIAGQAKQEIPTILQEMKAIGAINDDSFAESKVKSLIHSGCSHKIIEYKLRQKGIKVETIHAKIADHSDDDTELLAALIYSRKRRIGPFRYQDKRDDDNLRQKEKNSLARAGFSFYIADRVLIMERSEAEDMIDQLRFF